MQILIVEDEPGLRGSVAQAFAEAGYGVIPAATLAEARAALARAIPDLVILDVMLPDGNGMDLLEEIRGQGQTPVLMLTARSGLEDRVRGLDGGADDYLVKPFRLEELLARVRALLRRTRLGSEVITVGSLTIDLGQRRVTHEGRVIFLSTTEYTLLEQLARSAGEPVSKTAILRHVWDDESRAPNVVEVYINYLRHKLERGNSPRLIHTVRGRGYVLSGEPLE